jgi:ATP-dependent protease ClpP protease subunit
MKQYDDIGSIDAINAVGAMAVVASAGRCIHAAGTSMNRAALLPGAGVGIHLGLQRDH